MNLDMARYGAENDQMCFLCFHVFCVFFLMKNPKKFSLFQFNDVFLCSNYI